MKRTYQKIETKNNEPRKNVITRLNRGIQSLTRLVFSLLLIVGLSTPGFAGRITYTTTNSGLVSNYVYAVAIDSQGNKWFGTDSYLCKFDGTNWITYKQVSYVQAIAIDSSGNKWFGTNYYGVSKFDGTGWTNYTQSNSSLANNSVYAIAIDSSGNKWFATNGGVSKFDGSTWITYNKTNSGLVSNSVYSIVIDSQGNKWFGTSGGVNKFDGTTWWTTYTKTNSGLTSNSVYAIAIDSQGNKWFGTSSGVSKFDDTNWSTYTVVSNNYIKAIAIDSQGNKWFGTYYDGVSKFDGVNFTNYYKSSGGNVNYTTSIAIDSSGNKWIGTQGGVITFGSDNIFNTAPVLSAIGESGFISDGLSPEIGGISTAFTFFVKYTDAEGDEPQYSYNSYPRLHIKRGTSEISGSPFTMTLTTGTYSNGAIYTYSLNLAIGNNYTYYFEAYDAYNAVATGTLTIPVDAPDVVSLLNSYYIRGYVKDLFGIGGINGVTLSLTGTSIGTCTTGLTGYYEFLNLSSGSYRVTPTKEGYSFTPTSSSYISLSSNQENQTFLGIPLVLRISASVIDVDEIKIGDSRTVNITLNTDMPGILEGTINSNDNWITVSPTYFNGNTTNVTITITTSGMQNGEYKGNITIMSNGGTITIPVRVKATCVLVYPNPYSISSGKKLTFWGSGVVPNDTKIKIYTLGMDLVKTLSEDSGSNRVIWDGTNDYHEKVVPGIYFYTSESPKEHSTGRITVVK